MVISYKGYYVAPWRYEFLFECWKIFHSFAALTREIFFQHEKRNFVSPSGHVMFYLLYKHQWNTKPFHFNSFWCERRNLLCSLSNGDIFTYEDNMLFSHVKISCFRVKAHLVFHLCLHTKFFLVVQGAAKSCPLLLKKSTKKVEKKLYLKCSTTSD